ncbi:hypothetical protein DQ04_00411020 [Trypanosoma grayi]|uniref:hypothetical protein n=1 Tax=Trypanosoma grayi TaxID=71804 RepID=UPI0004F44235|nr:hypothetical protein DQ04_00411020 [Trypanosoma grayi]KEG14538.1 hypothetical protein DQ04_00411020 [Trypanosoma grayi]
MEPQKQKYGRVTPRFTDALLFTKKLSSSASNSSLGCYSDASNGNEQERKQQRLLDKSNYGAANDPYAALVGNAAEVRRRVHRANGITARLRDMLQEMTRPQQQQGYEQHQQEPQGEGLEKLYLDFEAEFTAALQAMRAMRYFGALTEEEKLAMPITRAAFIASRTNLMHVHRNQHELLSRLLYTAWKQQYRLRHDVVRRDGGAQCPFKHASSFPSRLYTVSNTHSGASWSLEESKICGITSSYDNSDAKDGNEVHDDMEPLRVLLQKLQGIVLTQQESLRRLEARMAGTASKDEVKAAHKTIESHRRSRPPTSGCCCSM